MREVSSSTVFTSLCTDGDAGPAFGGREREAEAEAEAAAAAASGASPLDRRAPSLACSTPIARD